MREHSLDRETLMRVTPQVTGLLLAVLTVSTAASALGQTESFSKYQLGTILEVRPHLADRADNASTPSYDISVRVGNTVYVVLYIQPPGTISPEYRAGLQLLVSVGSKTIKFNDQLGRTREVPIEGRRGILPHPQEPDPSSTQEPKSLNSAAVRILRAGARPVCNVT